MAWLAKCLIGPGAPFLGAAGAHRVLSDELVEDHAGRWLWGAAPTVQGAIDGVTDSPRFERSFFRTHQWELAYIDPDGERFAGRGDGLGGAVEALAFGLIETVTVLR